MSQDELFSSQSQKFVSVLTPYPVDKAYSYRVPDGMDLVPGDYVCVPLGQRAVIGMVWGDGAGEASSIKADKIKSVQIKFDVPPMLSSMREFIDWVADYTLSPKGSVLKMALSAPGAFDPEKPVIGYHVSGSASEMILKGLNPKQRSVVEYVHNNPASIAADIVKASNVSSSVIKTLEKRGVLYSKEMFAPPPCSEPDIGYGQVDLSPDQDAAAREVTAAVDCQKFSVALLDGVTGAGKTEVYFEAVAKAIETGKQALILLPEIALSNAFLDRFEKRFGCAPALWHSHLTKVQRRKTWRGVAEGTTKVVIGARSSLFLPYKDLGVIVVDEEHDPAYKQEDGVLYHARDMAIMRGKFEKFPVLLVSATPSLETMHNAWEGKYNHIHLPSRFGGARLPDIHIIDMCAEKLEAQKFLSSSLKEVTAKTLEAGEQVLYFLNRRGYAPLTLCRTCGHRMNCPRCTAWLVEHKSSRALHCHHCGFSQQIPKQCPSCGDEGSMAVCGPGVERIYEEAQEAFPEARIQILASDVSDNPDALREKINKIRNGSVDIIVGTQIIAKGHHFPNLTCVGVIDADLGLQGGDLRAAERTYQLLHQVAGRAGRAEKPGRVFLQSYHVQSRIMQAMASGHDALEARNNFLEAESAEREMAHMPPFSRLAGVIISGRSEAQVIHIAKELGRIAPQGMNDNGLSIQTLGPAPAPMAKLRGKYRYRLLVNADRPVNIQRAVQHWVAQVKPPSTVRIQVDIDPQSFL